MATNYSQAGGTISHTNGGSAIIPGGSVVVIGALIGVALGDIAVGETGTVSIEGVWELPKGANAIGAGAAVDYDVSVSGVDIIATPAAGDLVGCGVAVAAAAAGDSTVLVKINVAGASVS